MKKENNVRVLTKADFEAVNNELSYKFGTLNQIASGTCVECGKHKKRFYITLCDPNPYKPVEMMRKIGQIVKTAWNADEVYHVGKQIA